MELVAYNCLNAAVDLKGENWFYCNPLLWKGEAVKGGQVKTPNSRRKTDLSLIFDICSIDERFLVPQCG
jgi:hypothetical protein